MRFARTAAVIAMTSALAVVGLNPATAADESGSLRIKCQVEAPSTTYATFTWQRGNISTTLNYNNQCTFPKAVMVLWDQGPDQFYTCVTAPALRSGSKKFEHGAAGMITRVLAGC